jgi:hypothetical protein
VDTRVVQRALREAAVEARMFRRVTCRTFRHPFATTTSSASRHSHQGEATSKLITPTESETEQKAKLGHTTGIAAICSFFTLFRCKLIYHGGR